MTTKAIEAVKVTIIILLSFAFGWCANGYKIYAQDFGYKAEVIGALRGK